MTHPDARIDAVDNGLDPRTVEATGQPAQPVEDLPDLATYAPGLTAEQREQLLAVGARFAAFAEQIRQAFQAAAQQLAPLVDALQAAGLIDASGKPARRRDRPAWQSPYGPPTRRR